MSRHKILSDPQARKTGLHPNRMVKFTVYMLVGVRSVCFSASHVSTSTDHNVSRRLPRSTITTSPKKKKWRSMSRRLPETLRGRSPQRYEPSCQELEPVCGWAYQSKHKLGRGGGRRVSLPVFSSVSLLWLCVFSLSHMCTTFSH